MKNTRWHNYERPSKSDFCGVFMRTECAEFGAHGSGRKTEGRGKSAIALAAPATPKIKLEPMKWVTEPPVLN